MARFLLKRQYSKQEWRQKMQAKKNNQKEFSTCLEDFLIAETMQKTMAQQGSDPVIKRFPGDKSTLAAGMNSKSRGTRIVESLMNLHRCADCPIRCRAVAKPHSLIARIHRWHKTWWPGWKIYQTELHVNAARTAAGQKILTREE
jgi:hypothetical protein